MTVLSLPLTTNQAQTTEQIQSNLRHLRNVLLVIQSDYPSLQGSMLAVGSDALHVIAPQDNLEDVSNDLGAIAFQAFAGLGVRKVKLISGRTLHYTLDLADLED